jgi:hypothetical protein
VGNALRTLSAAAIPAVAAAARWPVISAVQPDVGLCGINPDMEFWAPQPQRRTSHRERGKQVSHSRLALFRGLQVE